MCDVQVVFWSVWPCCCFDNGARQKEQDTKDHGPGSWDHGAWQVVGGELGIFNRKKPIKPNDMKKCNFLKLERTLTNTRKKRKGSGSTHTKKTAHGFVLSRLKSRLHKSLLYKKRILKNYSTYKLPVENILSKFNFITALIHLNILILKIQELIFNYS